ncbi:hypothetical protein HN51_064114 [Arachis hypogaea]|uniref:Uncharacterized protein n=1 Tax=Arachis hypogaea TaxID=3818 RepID=A0A445AVP0_ARAHY|nr:uncharacterized protein DS421_11g349110 [Arachis hypogaea]RYR30489.1 hypothetical protein Ahy_B01g055246 [Arachis hypogaea]
MATGASQMMMVRGVMEGSISTKDRNVERRPYHKNCGCELHNSNPENGVCPQQRYRSISFNNKISCKHSGSLRAKSSNFSSKTEAMTMKIATAMLLN